MDGIRPRRTPLKTHPPNWKEKLRENCLTRAREERTLLLWKIRSSGKQAPSEKAIVESALRDLVSDELQKIKQSTTDDSQMISASKTYDAIWEYDGLHVDSYSSASESEELLLEMERLLYEDLREELIRRGSCGGFGSSPTQASPFGSTFQHTQSAFGSNLFGSSSTPAFGSASTPAFGSATAPTFGATTTPSFGSTSTPAFWSTTPLYGGGTGAGFGFSSTPSFGSYVTPAFGSLSPLFESSATPAFGTSTRAFGSSTTPTATATFGSPGIGEMAFGGQQVGSRVAPYTTTPETDLCTGSRTAGKLESISAMCGYKDKSVEELRWEDYQRGDKGRSGDASGWSRVLLYLLKLSVLALPMLYGIGQMVSGGGQQVGGSRVAPYTTTPETDLSTGSQTAGKLESISAMSMYKEKSFEELRWEDYQRGDKGRNRDASGWSRVLFFLRR